MNTWNNIKVLKSSDTNVRKYIFTKDDAVAEAVLYKYNDYKERTVMCISTQTGCPMGCTFCGTGKFFGRNLTVDEIVSQVKYMVDDEQIPTKEIRNFQIMVMSMGEPLLNMKNLRPAFECFSVDYPQAKLLVSTSAPSTKTGWIDMMEMSKELPQVGLQFSVHASSDIERDKIMPMKQKLNLRQIAARGLQFYIASGGRNPFFNYCVTEGNSTDEDILRLIKLFDPRIWQATFSVVCESDQSMSDAVKNQRLLVEDFSNRMLAEGYSTRVFDPAGQDDIGGGCGQLWAVQQYAAENPEHFKQSAGNKIACKNI